MTTPNTTMITCRIRRHRRRTAAVLALSSVAAAALAVTGNASAGGSDTASDSSAGLPGVLAQAAKAAPQAAIGASDTTLPGAEPNASSDAPSAQPTSSAEVPALDATTQQAATAVAGATQNNVQNIVVIIRINSPGNDVISQINTANAEAAATNDANTEQGSGAPPPPPAKDAPSGTKSLLRVASVGSERARPEVVPHQSGDRAGAQRRGSGAAHPAAAANRTPRNSRQYAASTQVAPRRVVGAAERSTSAPGSVRTQTSVMSVPARMGRAAARAGTGAAHFASSYVPQRTTPVDTADSISPAVILTLLAVILAVVLGAGSTYVPSLRARAWR